MNFGDPTELLTPPQRPRLMTPTEASDHIATVILEIALDIAADVMPCHQIGMRRTVIASALAKARQRNEAAIDDAAKLRQGLPADFHDDLQGAGR